MNQTVSTILIQWYRSHGRDLPWRHTRDPYAIWLSEVILQQTRIAQGLSYWQRFMHHFPTVERLASATEDEVLLLWQGLGYYSRARHLHEAARQIVARVAFLPRLGRLKALVESVAIQRLPLHPSLLELMQLPLMVTSIGCWPAFSVLILPLTHPTVGILLLLWLKIWCLRGMPMSSTRRLWISAHSSARHAKRVVKHVLS